MGTCNSSQEINKKFSSSKNLSLSLSNDSYPNYSSSSPLPIVSSKNKNSFQDKNDLSLMKKKYNSSDSSNSPKYILSEEIAIRDDITKEYKLGKMMLGDGATSIVYVAENNEKKKFAIKRILKDNIIPSHKNSVIKEAEICQKLNCDKIIKYYDIYEDLHYISIVMELAHTDLFELIIHCPSSIIPDEIAIEFLKDIFESIDYLHSQNIIHCDIKPENYVVIFNKEKIDEIPKLKLIDFGNVRKIPQKKQKLYNFSGTKEYMAPEIIDNSGFNEKIDEWAAGIIMYNMLTGVDPFSAEDDYDYKDNIKFKEINFNYIKDEQLRELNKKLLNRYVINRISAKEALNEIKKIKMEKAEKNIKNKEQNWNIIKNNIALIN